MLTADTEVQLGLHGTALAAGHLDELTNTFLIQYLERVNLEDAQVLVDGEELACVITLKCQPERIEDLKAQYDCIGNPYNESPKHWIGINPTTAPNALLQELTRNSYEIVKAKYQKVKKR